MLLAFSHLIIAIAFFFFAMKSELVTFYEKINGIVGATVRCQFFWKISFRVHFSTNFRQ